MRICSVGILKVTRLKLSHQVAWTDEDVPLRLVNDPEHSQFMLEAKDRPD
ncbi:MAG: hypothetical protein AMXMBFR84_26660 [Candidatus Hydrogenedentota bacterium]